MKCLFVFTVKLFQVQNLKTLTIKRKALTKVSKTEMFSKLAFNVVFYFVFILVLCSSISFFSTIYETSFQSFNSLSVSYVFLFKLLIKLILNRNLNLKQQ